MVAYNSEATIEPCLQQLRAAEGVAEVRVIDNNSSDSTLTPCSGTHWPTRVCASSPIPTIPGCAVACNQGAATSHVPWLAFVNPDCFVEADTLVHLRAVASAVGAAWWGLRCADEDGVWDAAARRRDPQFAPMLRSSHARNLSLPRVMQHALQPVDAVSGALMVLPRVVFERVGGFDAGYRPHAEDLDLCRRVRAAGARFAPMRCAWCMSAACLRARPIFVEWHKHRGLWRYFCKFEAGQCGMVTRMAAFA